MRHQSTTATQFSIPYCTFGRRAAGLGRFFAVAIIAAPSIAAGTHLHWSKPGASFPESAYGNRISQLAAAKKAEWNVFRDRRLGIEFSYPNDRKVTVGCRGSKNCVALIGKAMRSGDYIVAFEVFEGGLETTAVDHTVLQKKGDHWVANGHSGKYPVESLSGPGWQGLKSVVDCGISGSSGLHASAGECLWVVLSNGKRSVVGDTQGTSAVDQDTMRSILSIRLSQP